jgi:hypothetical protein
MRLNYMRRVGQIVGPDPWSNLMGAANCARCESKSTQVDLDGYTSGTQEVRNDQPQPTQPTRGSLPPKGIRRFPTLPIRAESPSGGAPLKHTDAVERQGSIASRGGKRESRGNHRGCGPPLPPHRSKHPMGAQFGHQPRRVRAVEHHPLSARLGTGDRRADDRRRAGAAQRAGERQRRCRVLGQSGDLHGIRDDSRPALRLSATTVPSTTRSDPSPAGGAAARVQQNPRGAGRSHHWWSLARCAGSPVPATPGDIVRPWNAVKVSGHHSQWDWA